MAEQTKASRDEQARGTSSLRTLYLTFFNTLFAGLWLWIGASALLNTSRGRFVLFEVVEPRARWVQTLTLVEVVHAAVGTSSSIFPSFRSPSTPNI
jgi:very-long-chain (3R)-3-hydroxyacyl-CoA dehydratase